MKTRYVLSCLLLGSALSVSAQKTAVKSNLLSAANGALNAGVEYAFGPKSTFDLSGSIRPWKRTEGYVNKYWLIQPEYRYWTCQKFNGSFWGAYLNGDQLLNSSLPPHQIASDGWRRRRRMIAVASCSSVAR